MTRAFHLALAFVAVAAISVFAAIEGSARFPAPLEVKREPIEGLRGFLEPADIAKERG